MERFTDQNLRPRPHIAVLHSSSVGEFMVITPLLRGLKEKYPDCTIDYLGGERTRELEEACPFIDWRFSASGLNGNLPSLIPFIHHRQSLFGPYDLALNFAAHSASSNITSILAPKYVVGSCFESGVRRLLPSPRHTLSALCLEEWSRRDLVSRYYGILETGFMAEILCHIAYVDTDFYREEAPEAPYRGQVPPVLIATGSRGRAKLWPVDHWLRLIRDCEARGMAVGLLSEEPAAWASNHHLVMGEEGLINRTHALDLRGKLSLPQVTSALKRAVICVTTDNGIMHLADAAGTPTVAILGASAWWQWAPRAGNLKVVLPRASCDLCERNDFKNDACLRDEHLCMRSIGPDRVMELVDDVVLERLGTAVGD